MIEITHFLLEYNDSKFKPIKVGKPSIFPQHYAWGNQIHSLRSVTNAMIVVFGEVTKFLNHLMKGFVKRTKIMTNNHNLLWRETIGIKSLF